jgi:hypothetical protein
VPRSSTRQLVREQLSTAARDESDFLELQIDWVRYKSGTPIARFGGLWDRVEKRFDGEAERSRTIEVHAAQIEAVTRFRTWMIDHLNGDREIDPRIREIIEGDLDLDAETGALLGLSEMFLTGGRRSGKTVVMEGILCSYAIAVPGSIVWTVVPSENFFSEPKKVINRIMPKAWFDFLGDPHNTYFIANGSEHVIRSGHKPTSLKQGEAALVGTNESQQITAESYRNARGATVDSGGFTLVAANPPTLGDVGTWVLDAVTQCEKGERPGSEHYFCDPLDNPHIDIRKLLALRSGMTEHDWQTQIRGRMLQLPDRVLYTWERLENERRPPDIGEVTHAFLTAHEGDRANWKQIVVVDVQSFPWIACGIARVFRDPRAPSDEKAGLFWLVDEVAIAQGDEVDVCAELKAKGIDGERTLVIMDASCRWFQMQRDLMKQRPNYKGKGSMDVFRRCGFPHVVPPDRKMKGNPDVFERIRATNATVRPADNIRGLYIDPEKCPNACESARKWRMHKSKPSRTSNMAHFGDVLGYLVWRFFPRRGSPSKMVSEAMAREHAEGINEL